MWAWLCCLVGALVALVSSLAPGWWRPDLRPAVRPRQGLWHRAGSHRVDTDALERRRSQLEPRTNVQVVDRPGTTSNCSNAGAPAPELAQVAAGPQTGWAPLDWRRLNRTG